MGVIPVPAWQQIQEGEYILKAPCSVAFENEELSAVANYLAETLKVRLGIDVTIEQFVATSGFTITLSLGTSLDALDGSRHLEEGYKLEIDSSSGVSIQGISSRGIFYGIQTLLQLLPVTKANPEQTEFAVQCVQILDAPRFRWRGVLLDVGRHFYSVAYIKRVLDLMAMHKMNVFHWHLTEDQGWRLEIKALPRLTDFGAWRRNGDDKYGGYYSQDEVRELVAYAATRGVDIMPEVELPGHCCAALASYTELSCTEQVTEVPYQWGIHEDVYCAGKEGVFQFLDKVFKEVAELFPFDYVHIGGDECPKVRWEGCSHCQERIRKEKLQGEAQLQSWFIQRAGKMLAEYNKKIVGWDEILEGGLPEGATVMSWRGMAGGIIAAKHGQDVIMTPTSHCYFDYKQSNSHDEPGAWYACLPLHVVYHFEPIPAPFQPVPPVGPMATSSPSLPATASGPTEQGDGTEAAAAEPMETDEAAAPASAEAADSNPAPTSQEDDSGTANQSDQLASDTTVPPQSCVSKQEDPDTGEPAASAIDSSVTASGASCSSPELSLPSLPPTFPPAAVPLRNPSKMLQATDFNLTPEEQNHILGGQANLWTEYVGDENTAEYMLLPRLCALSEALWSPKQNRDWSKFVERLKTHVQGLEALGYRYRALGLN